MHSTLSRPNVETIGANRMPVLLRGLAACGLATTLLACDAYLDAAGPSTGVASSVSIEPGSLNLAAGGTAYLIAVARDGRDRTTSASFAWSSANPAIATVTGDSGAITLITAISPGTTTVTLSAGRLRAIATVLVRDVDPAIAIAVFPTELTLFPGTSGQLTARTFDFTGKVTNESLTWSSADNRVATVGSTGKVTAIGGGSTTVTVAVGTLSATAKVSVVAVDGSFMFTRWTYSAVGLHTADVLWWSSADSTLRSLPRPLNHTNSIASPAWSPDGNSLALEVINSFDGHQLEGWTYYSDLYVVDAASPDDGAWRKLTTDGLSRSPSWSPDGSRIAFLRFTSLATYTNDIYVIQATGGIATRVPLPLGWHGRPRWSPDGTRLTFSSFMSFGSAGLSRVYVVDADGRNLASLTPVGLWDADPEWSPDGTTIVFVRFNSTHRNYDLMVANADGGNARALTSAGFIESPAWSPDGRQIIFSDDGRLNLINADGSLLRQLEGPPSGSSDRSPAWKR